MRGKDLILNRERFSVFNYTEEKLERYLARFRAFDPSFVYGYVSALEEFARFLSDRKACLRPASLKAVISTSEVLDPEARRRIESAFGVPVYDEYGCSELGTIAHECERGRLHVNSETLHVEIADESGAIREYGSGRLLVTEFHNRVQPLIRYDLGDVAELVPGDCPCGRSMPVIGGVRGKSYDIIFGPCGTRYFPEFFSYIFKDIQGHRERIRQFQVIQSDRDLLVNLVPGRDFDPGVEAEFQARIRREFGDFFRCVFRFLDQIPKEKSGKFRQVKRVRPDEPFPAVPVRQAELARIGNPVSVSG
jgi:phenylacetate-CoA ligase